MRIIPYSSTLLPSDNEWGIPLLDPSMQTETITAPIVRWGSVSRKTQHGGTWCFYVDDYRYGAWETLASRVRATNPAACVEPNYSAFEWTDRARVLWDVYRKRRVALQMQQSGIPILVDCCVPYEHYDLALIGVPKGWKSYATRGFEARAGEIEMEYRLAADHCAAPPLMLVYGGGPRVAEVCKSLPGTVHVRTKD